MLMCLRTTACKKGNCIWDTAVRFIFLKNNVIKFKCCKPSRIVCLSQENRLDGTIFIQVINVGFAQIQNTSSFHDFSFKVLGIW